MGYDMDVFLRYLLEMYGICLIFTVWDSCGFFFGICSMKHQWEMYGIELDLTVDL